ncbi:MAG: hypothetical protein IKC47_02335 [Clostridia bacterium]|nr:hypothetical protein [Clostridia bacterium]
MENNENKAVNNQKQVVVMLSKKFVLYSAICLLLVAVLVLTLVFTIKPKTFSVYDLTIEDAVVYKVKDPKKYGGYITYSADIFPSTADKVYVPKFKVFDKNGKSVSSVDAKIEVYYTLMNPKGNIVQPEMKGLFTRWNVAIVVTPLDGGKYSKYQPLVVYIDVEIL